MGADEGRRMSFLFALVLTLVAAGGFIAACAGAVSVALDAWEDR